MDAGELSLLWTVPLLGHVTLGSVSEEGSQQAVGTYSFCLSSYPDVPQWWTVIWMYKTNKALSALRLLLARVFHHCNRKEARMAGNQERERGREELEDRQKTSDKMRIKLPTGSCFLWQWINSVTKIHCIDKWISKQAPTIRSLQRIPFRYKGTQGLKGKGYSFEMVDTSK